MTRPDIHSLGGAYAIDAVDESLRAAVVEEQADLVKAAALAITAQVQGDAALDCDNHAIAAFGAQVEAAVGREIFIVVLINADHRIAELVGDFGPSAPLRGGIIVPVGRLVGARYGAAEIKAFKIALGGCEVLANR